MDFQTLANIALTAFLTVLGYFYRQTADKLALLEDKIHANEMRVATDYMRRDELMTHLNRMESMLGKIFDKLDNKVDK
jgi:outer membrane protein assembly factor BamD (BamD/ComL family)